MCEFEGCRQPSGEVAGEAAGEAPGEAAGEAAEEVLGFGFFKFKKTVQNCRFFPLDFFLLFRLHSSGSSFRCSSLSLICGQHIKQRNIYC